MPKNGIKSEYLVEWKSPEDHPKADESGKEAAPERPKIEYDEDQSKEDEVKSTRIFREFSL